MLADIKEGSYTSQILRPGARSALSHLPGGDLLATAEVSFDAKEAFGRHPSHANRPGGSLRGGSLRRGRLDLREDILEALDGSMAVLVRAVPTGKVAGGIGDEFRPGDWDDLRFGTFDSSVRMQTWYDEPFVVNLPQMTMALTVRDDALARRTVDRAVRQLPEISRRFPTKTERDGWTRVIQQSQGRRDRVDYVVRSDGEAITLGLSEQAAVPSPDQDRARSTPWAAARMQCDPRGRRRAEDPPMDRAGVRRKCASAEVSARRSGPERAGRPENRP